MEGPKTTMSWLLQVPEGAPPIASTTGAKDSDPGKGTTAASPLGLLTPRETEILALIAEGMSNREIASALFLAEKTVKNNVSGILSKLGMQRRTQAAVLGAEWLPKRDR